jgi:aminobenzoyl-glutamate utilization protein B
MSIGLKGALQAARALAWAGIDILTDADLRQAARTDFERRVQGQPYVSPLSMEMKHPLELPEWLTNDTLNV